MAGDLVMSNEKIRAFIAVDFPSEVIKEIARVQSVLGGQKFTGKMTELENLHLTLKFLGEISDEKLEEVRGVLREIKFGKFEARLADAGTFSYRGKPSIVWIKVGGKGIFELQTMVDEAMSKCGFGKEDRFMSHLTVARVKYVKSPSEFKEYVRATGVKDLEWEVGSFKLMKSELKPMGPVYTKVEEFLSESK
jgi:RNA 2',3'-cyclic 3'-phosphodiesterase